MKIFNKSLVTAMAVAATLVFSLGSCKKELYDPAAKTSNAKHGVTSLTDAYPASNDTTTVITPFGPRLKSEVITVQPGHHINYSPDGHIQIIETATSKMIKDFGLPVHTKAKLPPSGNRSVNSVQNNFTPSTVNPNYVEWALATNYKQGANIQAFSTTWKVPSLPTTLNDGQVIYIFNGLQSPDSVSLLQPVLQYGFDGTFGGNYWSVQNYFIPGCFQCSPVFHGTNIQVSPGTTLTGSMTKSGSAGTFSYTSSFGSSYSSNDLSVTNFPNIELEWGMETLEAYHILAYSDYPPDSAVRMTSITAGTTNIVTGWALNNAITNYGQHITQVSNTEIDLYFHWPNQIKSQSFTKNNCGSGYSGSSVIYTVPAGRYEAPTLSAANASAQSDITANGQNYANTYGSCILNGIAFPVTNSSGEGVSITFHRVDNSIPNINGNSAAHSGTTYPLSNIPSGVYNITFSPSGQPVNCTITLNTGQQITNAPGGTFSNITVGSTQTNSVLLH